MLYIRFTLDAEDSEFLCLRRPNCCRCLWPWPSASSPSAWGSSGASGGLPSSSGSHPTGGAACCSSPVCSVGGRGRNCLHTHGAQHCCTTRGVERSQVGPARTLLKQTHVTFGKGGGSGGAAASAGRPQVHCSGLQPHPSSA